MILKAAGITREVVRFAAGAVVFAQGARASSVFYIQSGAVRLSVVSPTGKEAVVAVLGAGEFFGEGCLAGQSLRTGTAAASVLTSVLRIQKREMIRMLHEQQDFSDRFLAHMLLRNTRIEEDLVEQLFDSSERRLARTLLLLARHDKLDTSRRRLPTISAGTLAVMSGTTRARVKILINKFRTLGFIEYDGGLVINRSLLNVVLRDGPSSQAGGAAPPAMSAVTRGTTGESLSRL